MEKGVPASVHRLVEALERVLRGKPEAIRLSVVALLGRGHLLIEDVPGVGKTTLAQALSRALHLSFRRIQCTSDMTPSDLLGVSVFDPVRREFEFKPGPLFSQVVLVDEVNRTPPRTQSALLQALGEGRVSADHATFELPKPFFVVATQNPHELHGTYPLPESELDRFLLRISLGYPPRASEEEILRGEGGGGELARLEPVLEASEVEELQAAAAAVRVDPLIDRYILDLVEATRRSPELDLGASPRGALGLRRAAQGLALVAGRDFVVPDDVQEAALPVLAHRVVPRGAASRAAAEAVLRAMIGRIAVPT